MQQEEQAAAVGAPLHGQHSPSVYPGSRLYRWPAVAAAAAAAATHAAVNGCLLCRHPLLLQQRMLLGWARPDWVHRTRVLPLDPQPAADYPRNQAGIIVGCKAELPGTGKRRHLRMGVAAGWAVVSARWRACVLTTNSCPFSASRAHPLLPNSMPITPTIGPLP